MADQPVSQTTFTPADMARAMGVGQDAQTGSGWFGPTLPLNPLAPPAVAGRQLDYQFAYNKLIQPKQGDGASVTFAQLRALSESWDILRSVIETRKDKGSTIPLAFRDKDWKPGKPETAAVKSARNLFRKPDGQHSLSTWRRMLREDMYVIDAPTVYVDRVGSRVRGFDIIDGATIKVLSDDYGRIPKDGPAFQQILKGVPAVDYGWEEIIYAPRNPRSHKFYGFSMVEQSILTIETGLRRALGQLNYFTDGNIPEMFISCPDTWNPDQVQEMQELWDSILSGNLKARSGARFIPGGMEPHQFRAEAILKNEFDEWVARIICFVFSVSPQPFVRDMNRATAQTAEDTATADGILSELAWEKDLFDEMLSRAGFDGVEAVHDTNQEPDAKTRSEIVMAQFVGGLIKPEFAIEKLGYPAEAMAEAKPGDASKPMDGKGQEPQADVSRKGAQKTCGHDHDAQKADILPGDPEADLFDLFQSALDQMLPKADAIAEAMYTGGSIPDLLWTKSGQNAFIRSVRVELGQSVMLGASDAMKLAGVETDLAALEAPAKEWAANRSAWLVGRRMVDGVAVENPNAEYAITTEVREAIRTTVARAFEERWTTSRLSDELAQSYAFSAKRALAIARTELANAQEAGNMAYARASGATKKRWFGAAGCCPICEANAEQGAIPLDDAFQSGHQHGPAHPNDRCRILPVFEDQNV